jgi:hypothetical protein
MEAILKMAGQYVLPYLIELAVSSLVALLAWAFVELRAYLKAKITNEQARAALDKIVRGIESEVTAVAATATRELKQRADDGVITKVEAKAALKLVGDEIGKRILDRYRAEVKTLSPDMQEVERIIRTEVEAAYARIRKN